MESMPPVVSFVVAAIGSLVGVAAGIASAERIRAMSSRRDRLLRLLELLSALPQGNGRFDGLRAHVETEAVDMATTIVSDSSGRPAARRRLLLLLIAVSAIIFWALVAVGLPSLLDHFGVNPVTSSAIALGTAVTLFLVLQLAWPWVPARFKLEDVRERRGDVDRGRGAEPMPSVSSFVAKMRDARVLRTEVLVDSHKRFVHEVLLMPDGVEIDWYYVDTAPSVMVVPVTAEGNVILVKQYRHNLKRDTLELPAGLVGRGEDLQAAALRELEEETGHAPAPGTSLIPLGSFYSLPSETNKQCNLFLAAQVVRAVEPYVDTEIERYFDMSTVEMPLDEAIKELGASIGGVETASALLVARTRLTNQ